MNEKSHKKEYTSIEIAKIKETIKLLETDNDELEYRLFRNKNNLDGMKKGMGGYAQSTRAYIDKIIDIEKEIKLNNNKIFMYRKKITNKD